MIDIAKLYWKIYSKGLSRKEIALAIGCSPQLVSMALKGKRPRQLPKIARFVHQYKINSKKLSEMKR